KRYSGRSDLSGQALDEANNALLLDRLRDVPDERRGAHYVCAAALVGSGGGSVIGIGTCRGRILREPAGSGGFGDDPLFLLPDFGRSCGELRASARHSASHRGRALRALAAYGGRQRGIGPRRSGRGALYSCAGIQPAATCSGRSAARLARLLWE